MAEAAPAPAPAPAPAAAEAEKCEAKPEGEEREGSKKKWFPLESNPDVMNAYMEKLGWPTEMYHCVDLLATEEWALAMVPQPVAAVVMLYPLKEVHKKHDEEVVQRIREEGQEESEKLWFTKQYVGNACGTIALFHVAANASSVTGDEVPLKEGSYFQRFFERTMGMTPRERAIALEEDDEAEEEHGTTAQQGQSAVTMDVETHFVAFVEKEGNLYELDGRKGMPVNHGPTGKETLLQDSVKVIRQFMDRDPEELRFTILAMAPNVGEED